MAERDAGTRRGRRAEADQAGTRESIMAAAAHVIARRGYQRASLDEIAAQAGLTKGAIYWHFRSKSDLFSSLLETRFQQHTAPLSGDMALVLAASDEPGRHRAIVALLQGVLRRFREDADWPPLFLEFLSQSRDPALGERLRLLYEHGRGLARQMVEQMKRAGLTDPGLDSDMVSMFWCALIDGFMMAWLVKPEALEADALIERLVGMLWCGLAPRQPSAQLPPA